MRIAVDAFGGDNAPLEILKGARRAADSFPAQLVLTGEEQAIKAAAAEAGISLDGIEIEPAVSVVSMHDDPKCVLKEKNDSSMAVGLKMVAEGRADAFVSAGSTGALLMGGTFIVRRAKGIKRPAIASVIPNLAGKFLLIDCGANVEARPDALVQFAQMGSLYMQKIENVQNPRVALINNGTEETKGTEVLKETYALLSQQSDINFVGNAEARELPQNACDVAVADGFCGNVVLKTMEGMGIALVQKLKGVFYKNFFTKLCALALKPALRDFKRSMDSSEYGGAPLLGLNKPVIKAHGSSDAKAIYNAVRQAVSCVDKDICALIAAGAAQGEQQ